MSSLLEFTTRSHSKRIILGDTNNEGVELYLDAIGEAVNEILESSFERSSL